MKPSNLNISFYKFFNFPEHELQASRAALLNKGNELKLKGTILIATEGINGFMSGSPEIIEEMKAFLRSQPYLADLEFKDSYSDFCPFTRMLVKIKKEIIAMGVSSIIPHEYTAPRIKPALLKEWIELGKDFVFLDTRNDYEFNLGTFKNSLQLNLKTFRQFPEKIKSLPEELKDKPIVTFCTGGIRCEKAAALMKNNGFKDVYQIDGGILKYFEETGGVGYEGECFVFDHRVAVDKNLQKTDTAICYKCSNPVTLEEQKSEKYVIGKSCPHCKDKPVFHKEQIAQEYNRALG